MDGSHDRRDPGLTGPKRNIVLSLDEELVRRAETLSGNLSQQVERLLADYVTAGERKADPEFERRLDHTIAALNEFDAKYGSFADEYLDDL